MKINYEINKISSILITNLRQIDNKRTLVNLYKDIVIGDPSTYFLCVIFYQQQHKSRDSNACLSVRSLKS